MMNNNVSPNQRFVNNDSSSMLRNLTKVNTGIDVDSLKYDQQSKNKRGLTMKEKKMTLAEDFELKARKILSNKNMAIYNKLGRITKKRKNKIEKFLKTQA